MSDAENEMGRLFARVWQDDAFKERLLTDPAGALAEEGIETSPGLTIRVLEDAPGIRHLVIPEQPPARLTDDALDDVAAAGEFCCWAVW